MAHEYHFSRLLGFLAILLISAFCIEPAKADIVKPALIEISADVTGRVSVEMRVSIEALLTGINSQYKNTKKAPTAAQYDELRVLKSASLRHKFRSFEAVFLQKIWLVADKANIGLSIASVKIPAPGYTKVPRISTIVLEGDLSRITTHLQFYYPAAFGDSAIRVRQVDKKAGKYHWSEWQWIRTDEPSQQFSLTQIFTRTPVYQVVISYITLGFLHILPKGLDHILFILGLFLFSPKLRPLFMQVTMFTVAHTLTLGLSMADLIELPARIVEPLIAASIAYVGIENMRNRPLKSTRLILVFVFGLLHGLGFASVLSDFGMQPEAFMTSLISFNVGVELGQLAILLACFGLVGVWFGNKNWYRKFITVPASAMISIIALIWVVERLELF